MTLPQGAPCSARRLLKACFVRDPCLRLRDLGDARIALSETGGREDSAIATASVEATRGRRPSPRTRDSPSDADPRSRSLRMESESCPPASNGKNLFAGASGESSRTLIWVSWEGTAGAPRPTQSAARGWSLSPGALPIARNSVQGDGDRDPMRPWAVHGDGVEPVPKTERRSSNEVVDPCVQRPRTPAAENFAVELRERASYGTSLGMQVRYSDLISEVSRNCLT